MSHNAFVSCYIHYIFSTKGRIPSLVPEIRERLWAYLGGIARAKGMEALSIGGEADHMHALISLPPTYAIAKGIQLLKGSSSKWMHDQFPDMLDFAWQEGYGAFSVGYASLDNVTAYIRQQAEHHRRHTYQEELLAFLQRYQIPYDDRYVLNDDAGIVGS